MPSGTAADHVVFDRQKDTSWTPNPSAICSTKKQQIPPAVTLEGTPSEKEATWLLALAILQMAFHNLLETVWTN